MLSDHASHNSSLITALTITSQSISSALAQVTILIPVMTKTNMRNTVITTSMLTNLASANTPTVLVGKVRVVSVVTCSAEALQVES